MSNRTQYEYPTETSTKLYYVLHHLYLMINLLVGVVIPIFSVSSVDTQSVFVFKGSFCDPLLGEVLSWEQ